MDVGPQSFLDCFDDDGDLDQAKFTEFVRNSSHESFVKKYFKAESSSVQQTFDGAPRAKKTRIRYERNDPKVSTWFRDYVAREVLS